MNRALPVGLALALLSSAPACGFYFGDDDSCDGIDYGGSGYADTEAVPQQGLRNPDTGQCEYFGGGTYPPYPCDSECGPCPGDESRPQAPQPTWGFCEGFCTGLDEATCLATPGCRGAYIDGGSSPDVYAECWQTDQSGPIQGGTCAGLDAYTCSMHDDCIAVHTSACESEPDALFEPTCLGFFAECAAEPGNNSDPGTCYDPVTCDETPPDCPPNTIPGVKDGCYTGFCIPVDQCEGTPACSEIVAEMACIGRADCTPLYEGVDCSCDANGCTCSDWVFQSCDDS